MKWGPSKFYFLKDFAKIPHSIVLDHQTDTNKYCSKHDQQSRNWLYALVFSMMTVELCDCDIPTYNEIFSSQQGGIALTKLVLEKIFFISCNVINALKNFSKIFKSKGLIFIQGKNISVITNQLHLLWLVWIKLAPCQMKPMEIFFAVLPSLEMKTSRQFFSLF